jgi:hypothetical protein
MSMNKNKSAFRKTLLLASIAYGAFTTLSVVVPIILDRVWNKPRQ